MHRESIFPVTLAFGLLAALSAVPGSAETAAALTSSVLISNPGTADSSATLKLYNRSGADSGLAPVQVTIPAKGHKIIELPLTATSEWASAQVLSEHPLEVLQLGLDSGNLARQIYGAAGSAATIYFPAFRHHGDPETSTIVVQNVSSTEPVNISLHCVDGQGSEQTACSNASQALPPLGQHRYDSQTLFGPAATALFARLEATGPVAAVEQINLPSGNTAFAGASASDWRAPKIYVPAVEHSGRGSKAKTWSEVYVQNLGTAPADLTLTYFSAKGKRQGQQTATIAAGGGALFDSRSQKKSGLRGYGTLTQAGAAPLAVQWLVLNKSGTNLIGGAGIDSNRLAPRWACADTRRQKTPAQNTRLTVLNVSVLKNSAAITLYDPESGSELVTKSVAIKAGAQSTVKLAAQNFRKAGTRFAGLALVASANGEDIEVSAADVLPQNHRSGYSCSPLEN